MKEPVELGVGVPDCERVDVPVCVTVAVSVGERVVEAVQVGERLVV